MIMTTAYIEDKNLLAKCTDRRDFSPISTYIQANKKKFSFYAEEANCLYGFDCKRIDNLSKLYNTNMFAINFFYDIDDGGSFDSQEIDVVSKMFVHLQRELDENRGYYILRVPSSNIHLLHHLKLINNKMIFAGNTICYYSKYMPEKLFAEDGLTIEVAKKSNLRDYREVIMNLSKESFDKHFTQYHISDFTKEKAPTIYSNWIKDFLDNEQKDDLIVARVDDNLVGFLAFEEKEESCEIILNCVDEKFRGKKVYERMLRHCVTSALNKNKFVTISTQLNNYFPQRAWVNCGFKPYHSFYLMHYNSINY